MFCTTNMTDKTLTEIFSVPGSFPNLPSGHLTRGISMPTTELSKQTVPSSYKAALTFTHDYHICGREGLKVTVGSHF